MNSNLAIPDSLYATIHKVIKQARQQAPCEGASAANAWSGWTEQRGQGQKGACSVHLNFKRFGYIILYY